MKNQEKNRKHTLRSILISAVVVLFFVGVMILFYTMLYSETKENIIKNGELSSVTSAEQIDKFLSKGIETIRIVCYTLDNMIRTGKSTDEIYDFLLNQSAAIMSTTEENSSGVYGIFKGVYLDGSQWVPDDDYVPTERPWYIAARASVGRVSVVDPYVDAQTHTVLITFCKTLCDARSVAAMDFYIDRLQEITEEIAAEDNLDAEIVLDHKYQVIAHSDASEVGKSYLAEGGTFGHALVSALRTADKGYFSVNYGGKEYIVYAVSVSNDWICLSVYNASTVFSQLILTVFVTIAVSLLVVFVLLFILIRSNRKEEQFSRMQHVVEALASAIDAKDAYTNGHSSRVADYAREISKIYGYSPQQQDEIYMMGLLHDVGKIGVPDAVINKPGRLTEEEYGIIRTHPSIGSQMLSKSTDMRRMAAGARWHHERYDGQGYPDGLDSTNIPEAARIIAVADAYDAMTSRRSYREALPQAVVRKEIEDGRGTQFDPGIADIMLRMIDEDKDYRMHA